MTDQLAGAVERAAQAMADHANKNRYVLENDWQSTGVEPYEHSAEDFRDLAEVAVTAVFDERRAND